ncbi:hypothetical protein FB451DRAFT_478773 [Mycena latifolia]|nr:hypothetical protein FB451DRAFT_478773 [Mycena latifolia]
MILISLPAANQATLLCTFVIPALSLVPLLALVILVMKRKRLPPTATDLEDQGSFKKDALFEGADEEPPTPVKVLRSQSPPRKKLRARKAIPRRMQHMKNNMTVWGDRWLPAVQPSTAGSQQGEIDPSGMYTASRSPPPSYRTTPLSPVVMPSGPSSPNPLPLSSDFKVVDDPAPPQPSSPAFDKMFLFGDSFGLGLADSFAEFETADQGPAYSPFPEGPCGFDFTAEAPFSLSINTHPSYNASAGVPSFHSPSTFTPPHPDPFSNPLAPMEFHSGIPIANAPSNLIILM